MARQNSKADKKAKRAKKHRKRQAKSQPVTLATLEKMSRRERIRRLEVIAENYENRITHLEGIIRERFPGGLGTGLDEIPAED